MLMGFTFLAHFNRLSISVAANAHFIGEGKLSAEQMGLVYSAFLLVYTIGMLPGGWLIDRVGPRWAMTGLGLGFGLCAALTGVLGWLGLTITAMLVPLLVLRGLAGAASSPLHPGAARTVSLWVPVRERSTANGLVTAGALIGIAATYVVFGALMDHLGWPGAFVASGAALAALGLVWFVLAADDPTSHPGTNMAERHMVAAGRMTPARTRTNLRDFFRLFRNRSLVLLALSYGCLGYVQYLFFYWVEYYFKTVLERSESESRDAATIITVVSAVGMAAGGWVADWLCHRFGHTRGCRVVAMSGMGLSGAFSLLGVATQEPAAVVLFFSLALASLGMCEGVFWTTAPALEPRNGGLAGAVLNTGGNAIGMLAPIVTPVLGRHYGWGAAVMVACVVSGVGGLLWLAIRPAISDGAKVGGIGASADLPATEN